LANLSALECSIDELAAQFKEFYQDAHRKLFNITLKQVWLEMRVVYQGRRRRRRKNGFREDSSFGWFMKGMVGISQKPIVANMCFTAIATYLKDFFPDFLNKNPFEDEEYFEYPYEHVTIDQMFFVYQCEDRLEMLEYAEKEKLNYLDFVNWATNHVMCYNDEIGQDKYTLSTAKYMWPYIKNNDYKRTWSDIHFDFDYEETKV
jgi:hypothetical protein